MIHFHIVIVDMMGKDWVQTLPSDSALLQLADSNHWYYAYDAMMWLPQLDSPR